jgi:hypothetical protein
MEESKEVFEEDLHTEFERLSDMALSSDVCPSMEEHEEETGKDEAS